MKKTSARQKISNIKLVRERTDRKLYRKYLKEYRLEASGSICNPNIWDFMKANQPSVGTVSLEDLEKLLSVDTAK